MNRMILKAGAQRATGAGPSHSRAFLAATATAVTLGVVAYKIRRSGD
jgi:hypothetical protein